MGVILRIAYLTCTLFTMDWPSIERIKKEYVICTSICKILNLTAEKNSYSGTSEQRTLGAETNVRCTEYRGCPLLGGFIMGGSTVFLSMCFRLPRSMMCLQT